MSPRHRQQATIRKPASVGQVGIAVRVHRRDLRVETRVGRAQPGVDREARLARAAVEAHHPIEAAVQFDHVDRAAGLM
jgi:hypothetical protein